MRAKKLFFKECHLAGRQYHDVDEVWDDLKFGTLLRLERDVNNHYDDHAVAVLFDKPTSLDRDEERADDETYLLGYIPSDENEFIAKLLDMGWTDIFECRICRINPDAHYENQIYLSIRIKPNPVCLDRN